VTPRPEIVVPQQRIPEQLFPPQSATYIGPNLFNPPPHQGFITLTPTFTLSGTYNDNVNLDNQNRKADGIIGFSPGLTLSAQRPGFRLTSAFNTSGQLFLDETNLSGFGKQVQMFGDLLYQPSPRVTLTASDQLFYDRNSAGLTSGGVSVGF